MDNDIKQKLNKLYELSVRGVKGEKDNASVMLDKLLKKYNLTIGDVIEDRQIERYFYYSMNEHKKIICQIIFSINGEVDVYSGRKGGKKCVSATITDYENVQVSEAIKFHIDLYNKERKKILKDLTSAYVQKHKLYSDNNNVDDDAPLTAEEKTELMRIANIYFNLSDKKNIKSIGST